jgi:hypothetical protein
VPEIPANGETTLIVQPDTAYHAVSGDQVFDFMMILMMGTWTQASGRQ